MSSLVKLMMAIIFSVLSLSALAEAEPKLIKSFVAGNLDVRGVAKTMNVYAVYEGEEEATQALRARIAELGYKLADRPESANVIFRVSKTYYGEASDRPKVGKYDGDSGSDGFRLGNLLAWTAAGLAMGITPANSTSTFSQAVFGDFWSHALRSSGAISELEHAFKPTSDAQEAVVSHVELTVNGKTQTADVVSESFAEGLPRDAILAENLRQSVWYLE